VFPLKVANAQASGAKEVIANNVSNHFPGMGGTDLVTPRISAVGVTQAAGFFLKTQVGVDVTRRRSSLAFRERTTVVPAALRPNPVQPGSSVSTGTSHCLRTLMEPFLNADLKGAKTLDLTPDR
jgi:hypothetical protein